jgi:sodium/potassium-transporting ATPase subunit beta
MAEEKYVFHDDEDRGNKTGFKSKLDGFLEFVWNSRTKEFLGRDGASWAKVSLFYGVFYLLLGGFFIGMLSVFFYMTPTDKPTYYGVSSIMNSRTATLNPGLGFRPQIDPEDNLIKYNPLIDDDKDFGLQKYVKNLRIFLREKYSKPDENVEDCKGDEPKKDLAYQGKSCKFDYEELFKNTPCTEANYFNYKNAAPCVLLKLNKIVSWIPESAANKSVTIECVGENSFDKDNLKQVVYYSENGEDKVGKIPLKYFPYNGQKSYRSPFVWVKLNVTENVLVNIECNAYASNIENERITRRGLTKFALFLQSDKNRVKREL